MIKKIYPAIHHFLVVLTALFILSTVPVMANEKTVALTESELNALIDARIEKALARYQLDNGGFDAKVEKTIEFNGKDYIYHSYGNGRSFSLGLSYSI